MNLIQQYVREALSEQSVQKETITLTELKEVIKHTLRSILMEMHRAHKTLSILEEGPIPVEDLATAWRG